MPEHMGQWWTTSHGMRLQFSGSNSNYFLSTVVGIFHSEFSMLEEDRNAMCSGRETDEKIQ